MNKSSALHVKERKIAIYVYRLLKIQRGLELLKVMSS